MKNDLDMHMSTSFALSLGKYARVLVLILSPSTLLSPEMPNPLYLGSSFSPSLKIPSPPIAILICNTTPC